MDENDNTEKNDEKETEKKKTTKTGRLDSASDTARKKGFFSSVKRYANNGFWGAVGGALGYYYNDSQNKYKDRKWRRKIGFLGSAGILYATIMLFSTGMDRGFNAYETKLKQDGKLDSMKIEMRHEMEMERLKKGYDGKMDSIKEQVSAMQLQTQSLYATIDGKVQGLDGKVQGIGTEIKNMTKNQASILGGQKELTDNLKNIQKSTLQQKVTTQKDYDKNNAPGNHVSTKSLDKIGRFLIVADKSDQKLTLWDDAGNKLYESRMIYAKTGGPDNGQYDVKAVQPRSGELYPGVTKMTDIIVITGSGENSRYDYYINKQLNVNRTGIRTYNDDYKNLSSMIKGRNAVVLVRE